MSFFADAMADALPALKEALGESVAHYVPDTSGSFDTSEAEFLTALFEETDSAEADQREGRQGLTQARSGKLTLDPDVVVVLGKFPSRFEFRGAVWKAVAVIAGHGVQTVCIERTNHSTLRRPDTSQHQ
jgi:hypothetical protein